jgi:hypothetical protein
METVSNLTSAASRAIWGDPDKDKTSNETGGQEPLSGEVGDVSAGEPYDKGNAGMAISFNLTDPELRHFADLLSDE